MNWPPWPTEGLCMGPVAYAATYQSWSLKLPTTETTSKPKTWTQAWTNSEALVGTSFWDSLLAHWLGWTPSILEGPVVHFHKNGHLLWKRMALPSMPSARWPAPQPKAFGMPDPQTWNSLQHSFFLTLKKKKNMFLLFFRERKEED